MSVSFSVADYFRVPLFLILPWRDVICYNLPLLLTPLSVGSSKVHPCGDQWHNFITSVAGFGVWVIANCIHFFKISSVVGPFLESVSWLFLSSTAVNAGEHLSVWMVIFRNIGPDMSIKILGFAPLKFFSSGLGGCPFLGLLPMSIPTEHVEGLHYLWALSPIYHVQTVRIALLSDAMWFLVVYLIGIRLLIVRESEQFVLWPFGFVSLKGVRKIYLCSWLLGSRLCWNLFLQNRHWTFPEGSCH